ncbi:MAG: glutamyl-tRNA reductase [Planctomycetes bacterium]|jgi:glutamyl-tRNA reductase|nr:glutamyl-tRNA reductase [Planctomycetota bacterium]
MRVLMLGINHRTAPLALREKLAISEQQLPATLARFAERFAEAQCVVLSTCNRTELYVARPTHSAPSGDELRRFLAEHRGVDEALLSGAAILREQDQAVGHLFHVAAGLDSMVLGETQVLGQVRRAYEAASAAGTVGRVLHQVFQQAIAAAKRLHHTTGISAGRQSVGSVGVEFIRQVFETLEDKTLLCIGAGEVGKVVLQHALRLQPGRVLLVNRTAERATALAAKLGLSAEQGGARPWDALDELLIESDVVLASTGASAPIVSASRLKPLLRKRRGRPLFMLDAALPRDLDPAIGSLSNVYLYNLDDLRPVVERSLEGRRDEIDRCRAQVRGAAGACMNAVQHQDIGRLVRALRHRLHEIADDERRRTARKLGDAVDPHVAGEVEALLDEHTRRLINKVLHLPLSRLDANDPEAPLGFYAAALRRLFDLEDAASADAPPPEPSQQPPPTPAPGPAWAEPSERRA